MVHLKLRNLKLTIFILPESDVSHVFTLLVTSTDWDWDSWDHDQWEQSRVNTGHCSRTHQRQHCPWYSSSPILRCHTALQARARYSANTLFQQMYFNLFVVTGYRRIMFVYSMVFTRCSLIKKDVVRVVELVSVWQYY